MKLRICCGTEDKALDLRRRRRDGDVAARHQLSEPHAALGRLLCKLEAEREVGVARATEAAAVAGGGLVVPPRANSASPCGRSSSPTLAGTHASRRPAAVGSRASSAPREFARRLRVSDTWRAQRDRSLYAHKSLIVLALQFLATWPQSLHLLPNLRSGLRRIETQLPMPMARPCHRPGTPCLFFVQTHHINAHTCVRGTLTGPADRTAHGASNIKDDDRWLSPRARRRRRRRCAER